jgi:hypothetical protein
MRQNAGRMSQMVLVKMTLVLALQKEERERDK